MPTEAPETPDVWAVVDILGHKRYAGRLSEVEKFGGKLGRVDVPAADGSFVTHLFGSQSVYGITFVTEQVARDVAKKNSPAPVQPWDYPKALPAGPSFAGLDDDDGPDDTDRHGY